MRDLTSPDSIAETEAKLATIEEETSWVVGTYVGALLYAYRNFTFGC